MPVVPWNLTRLTRSYPILLEIEERKYKSPLLVVDNRKHWEGRRIGKVIMKHSCVSPEINVQDRVIIKGFSGKTRDTEDKIMDEKYRFVRQSDIEAVLPENLDVECYAR